MGMPTVLTQNGTGTSAVWVPDWMQTPFSVSFGTLVTGAAGYSVEFTMQDLDQTYGTTAANATWFPHAIVTGISVATTGTVTFPVRGLRVNVLTAGSIASAVSVNFIQATFGR